MNYTNPKLQTLLAGEYVLGNLQGLARSRFERLLEQDTGLQNETVFWQQKLNALGTILKPINPPKRVWTKIANQLNFDSIGKSNNRVFNMDFWRGFSVATIALVFVFTLGIMPVIKERGDDITDTKYFTVLQDNKNKPALIVSINDQVNTILIEKIHPIKLKYNQVLQVWCLPDDDEPPMSIGLLKGDLKTQFELSEKEMEMLKRARAISISIEPKGGSPTNLPSGPVVYLSDSIIT